MPTNNGRMDEIAIWTRELSEAEILDQIAAYPVDLPVPASGALFQLTPTGPVPEPPRPAVPRPVL